MSTNPAISSADLGAETLKSYPVAPEDIDASSYRSFNLQTVQNIKKQFLGLATSLLATYEGGYVKLWGFSNFVEYTEEELALPRSTAYSLLKIATAIKDKQLSYETASKLGLAKTDLVCTAINKCPKKSKKFIEMGETLSKRELALALKKELPSTKGKQKAEASNLSSDTLKVYLNFTGDARQIFSKSIEKMGKILGTHDASTVIAYILREFLSAEEALEA